MTDPENDDSKVVEATFDASDAEGVAETEQSSRRDGDAGAGTEQGGHVDPGAGTLMPLPDEPPTVLSAVILDDFVPFPGPVAPILLDDSARRDAILNAKSNNTGHFLLINRGGGGGSSHGAPSAEAIDPGDGDPAPSNLSLDDVASMGIVANITREFQLPDDRMSVLASLMRRARVVEILKRKPFPVFRVEYPVDTVSDEGELEANYRQVRIHLQQFFEAHPNVSDELKIGALGISSHRELADFVGQHLSRTHAERLEFLYELDLTARMRRALEVVIREYDLLTVGNRISDEIRKKVEKHQREFFLREQLKSIRTELGEEKDPAALAAQELEDRLMSGGLPEHARVRAEEELKRLQLLPPESPEHNVVRSYLDWIVGLPWAKSSDDLTDIVKARKILDEDHYGLEEIKDRIIEFLAVRQFNPKGSGTVGSLICFAGPPGVGKTSLGKSIARALGREFYRFSVGGMRDEAEIKGHRRTYVGAMPGRVLQALKQVSVNNPVIMLDEIDKMGSDWRGDPSSAMLEVLDPAQNATFLDHYLDLSFDLSKVMFIATANVKAEIPRALLDRLEVIDLPGYIPEEKLEIAARYLLPRQRKQHGLTGRQLSMGKPILQRIIRDYTYEAGVRELERLVAKVCRKRVTKIVARQGIKGRKPKALTGPVKSEQLTEYLGPPRSHEERFVRKSKPGVALGLAWTAVGGDVLVIEAVSMPGKGVMKVTGQLGDVMSESAALALSYVRDHADSLQIEPEVFTKNDLHLHFPAGAVRKDGPSAGVTITSALISLLTQRSVRAKLAMTGEMTLRGEVLPVGGIREKVVAARRAGVTTIVVPAKNRADVGEIPDEVKSKLTFVYAEHYDDVLAAAVETRKSRVSR